MGTEIFSEFKKVFVGAQFAVGLSDRAPGDKHVCIQILSEDDGHWFVNENRFSSFWLPDLQRVLNEADIWMKLHCIEDGKFGYKFGK